MPTKKLRCKEALKKDIELCNHVNVMLLVNDYKKQFFNFFLAR